tara:strand:- start:57 stop:983 length:927 start_codon:yes stop_codon:yes gene_type:complete
MPTYNYTNALTQSAYYGTAANFGNYQFVTLGDICDQFLIAWCGDDKVLAGTSKGDVYFHAHRTLQELHYDTLRSCKSQEIEVPPGLVMPLPHDYVNYVKIVYVDSGGIEHTILPMSKTSNPFAIKQNAAGTYQFTGNNLTEQNTSATAASQTEAIKSDTADRYSAGSGNTGGNTNGGNDTDVYDAHIGTRYGLEPEFANSNGWFYIDCRSGMIHFSSNLNGMTITLKYISDGIGTEAELVVHKFAEEAMYQNIAYALASTKQGIQEYIIGRFRQTAIAAKRKAKLRLSNIKLEEISQIFRGKAKQIKH